MNPSNPLSYPVRYTPREEIFTTDTYDKWFRKLKDTQARARISITLRRCQLQGEMVGDLKPVGDQVLEMRFHFGPGYRVYYTHKGDAIVLLLIGGDKTTQQADIDKAKTLAIHLRKDQQ